MVTINYFNTKTLSPLENCQGKHGYYQEEKTSHPKPQ